MPSIGDFDCEEWSLLDEGTVLMLAKHNEPRVDSKVLWEDIANAIDGGEGATDAQKQKSLLGGCGTYGGQLGVKVNTTNPAYATDDFKSGNVTNKGILIKIVRKP
jgi:hypothetical protein